MSPQQKPPWWRGFDKLERAIGEPLERAAVSNRYVDLMVKGIKLQRAIGGRIGGLAGGATERVLRLANIPTRADIRRINQQLAVLTREVRELSTEQREALHEHPTAPPERQLPTGRAGNSKPARKATKRKEADDVS
jgi:hypothetical protein